MTEKIHLSVIIPLYNEEENIELLFKALVPVLKQFNQPWEILFIDDGSKDSSFGVVKKIHEQNPEVNGISLSRNFGHETAMLAGMQHAKGDVVVIMDADLQHPPEVIPRLYEEYKQGFDIVNTHRIDSRETDWLRKFTAKFFYRLIDKLSDVPFDEASSDFKLISRKALDAYLQFQERDRFTRGLLSWMGFPQTIIDYECPPRFAGRSKYNFKKLLHLALDGITSFSAKPLRIASVVGFFVCLFGMAYAIYAVVQYFKGSAVPGWPSLMITVLIIGGIQLLTIGIIGEYIARIFNESKARPIYFIKDKTK